MISIAVLASHSALDVLDGAKDEGFKTIAVAKVGRDRAYKEFPVVDKLIVLKEYNEILRKDVIEELICENCVFIPNRSFSVYVGYDAIEKSFPVPIFGNRYLLRWEERSGDKNYYRLLDEAGIKRPRVFRVDDVDRPVIVKVPHAAKRVERGFFIASDRDDLLKKAKRLAEKGVIRLEDLESASIEELVIGAHFSVNYFNSRIRKRLELHSFDRRIQSNLDGILRLPAREQLELELEESYVEVGHESATIRESLLESIFEIGYRFVESCSKLVPPGIIGPFSLQLIVTSDLDLVVYDVSTRIGGGTNAYMGVGSQYSKLYFRRPISIGRRIAIELREAWDQGRLDEVVT